RDSRRSLPFGEGVSGEPARRGLAGGARLRRRPRAAAGASARRHARGRDLRGAGERARARAPGALPYVRAPAPRGRAHRAGDGRRSHRRALRAARHPRRRRGGGGRGLGQGRGLRLRFAVRGAGGGLRGRARGLPGLRGEPQLLLASDAMTHATNAVGRYIRESVAWYGGLGLLTAQVVRNIALPPHYFALVAREIDIIGVRSTAVALTAALFTGMVLALQTAVNMARFGAENYVGPVVALSI